MYILNLFLTGVSYVKKSFKLSLPLSVMLHHSHIAKTNHLCKFQNFCEVGRLGAQFNYLCYGLIQNVCSGKVGGGGQTKEIWILQGERGLDPDPPTPTPPQLRACVRSSLTFLIFFVCFTPP